MEKTVNLTNMTTFQDPVREADNAHRLTESTSALVYRLNSAQQPRQLTVSQEASLLISQTKPSDTEALALFNSRSVTSSPLYSHRMILNGSLTVSIVTTTDFKINLDFIEACILGKIDQVRNLLTDTQNHNKLNLNTRFLLQQYSNNQSKRRICYIILYLLQAAPHDFERKGISKVNTYNILQYILTAKAYPLDLSVFNNNGHNALRQAIHTQNLSDSQQEAESLRLNIIKLLFTCSHCTIGGNLDINLLDKDKLSLLYEIIHVAPHKQYFNSLRLLYMQPSTPNLMLRYNFPKTEETGSIFHYLVDRQCSFSKLYTQSFETAFEFLLEKVNDKNQEVLCIVNHKNQNILLYIKIKLNTTSKLYTLVQNKISMLYPEKDSYRKAYKAFVYKDDCSPSVFYSNDEALMRSEFSTLIYSRDPRNTMREKNLSCNDLALPSVLTTQPQSPLKNTCITTSKAKTLDDHHTAYKVKNDDHEPMDDSLLYSPFITEDLMGDHASMGIGSTNTGVTILPLKTAETIDNTSTQHDNTIMSSISVRASSSAEQTIDPLTMKNKPTHGQPMTKIYDFTTISDPNFLLQTMFMEDTDSQEPTSTVNQSRSRKRQGSSSSDPSRSAIMKPKLSFDF